MEIVDISVNKFEYLFLACRRGPNQIQRIAPRAPIAGFSVYLKKFPLDASQMR